MHLAASRAGRRVSGTPLGDRPDSRTPAALMLSPADVPISEGLVVNEVDDAGDLSVDQFSDAIKDFVLAFGITSR